MSFDTVELIKANKVAIIKLNRPELLNAVNEQLIWDLQKVTADVRDDKDIKVVIIAGAGRAFSAGADLSESESSWESSKDALMRGYKPIFLDITSMHWSSNSYVL
jgi:2-(1,2-epoxy-1,2-dihydrophenyl)acetyl-CoA isomerase